jgi:hypothetical protein
LTGVASLAPGLIIASVAVVAARAVVPVADAVARVTLRRGRLGLSLAAAQLARRPGSPRLLILLIVATALLGFSAAGLNVADQARRDRADVDTGASTVVEVSGMDVRTLLATVRAIDPAARTRWRWPVSSPTRRWPLCRHWPSMPRACRPPPSGMTIFGIDPTELAGLLHPPRRRRFRVAVRRGQHRCGEPTDAARISRELVVSWESLAGAAVLSPGLDLRPGRHQYQLEASVCADGCRLVGIRLRTNTGRAVEATGHDIRASGATSPLVPLADLTDPRRWRVPGDTMTPLPDGMRLLASPTTKQSDAGVWVVDSPLPLPVVGTGAPGAAAEQPSPASTASRTPSVEAARATMLPRVGSAGTWSIWSTWVAMSTGASTLTGAEVWLGPTAAAGHGGPTAGRRAHRHLHVRR